MPKPNLKHALPISKRSVESKLRVILNQHQQESYRKPRKLALAGRTYHSFASTK